LDQDLNPNQNIWIVQNFKSIFYKRNLTQPMSILCLVQLVLTVLPFNLGQSISIFNPIQPILISCQFLLVSTVRTESIQSNLAETSSIKFQLGLNSTELQPNWLIQISIKTYSIEFGRISIKIDTPLNKNYLYNLLCINLLTFYTWLDLL